MYIVDGRYGLDLLSSKFLIFILHRKTFSKTIKQFFYPKKVIMLFLSFSLQALLIRNLTPSFIRSCGIEIKKWPLYKLYIQFMNMSQIRTLRTLLLYWIILYIKIIPFPLKEIIYKRVSFFWSVKTKLN